MQAEGNAGPPCACGCGQAVQPAKRTNRGIRKGEYPGFLKGHRKRPFASVAERFWAKVDRRGPDDCWLWTGALFGYGYGQFQLEGKSVGAHVMAYRLAKGEVAEGQFVCHACDRKACVNPAHLWLGTNAENVADCFGKGLHNTVRGVEHPRTTLEDEDVREIRRLYAERILTQDDLAAEYGVTQATIWRILHRVTWKHIA